MNPKKEKSENIRIWKLWGKVLVASVPAALAGIVFDKILEKITGKDIDIQADSVCVHGDGAKALLFVEKLRSALIAEGVEICALK